MRSGNKSPPTEVKSGGPVESTRKPLSFRENDSVQLIHAHYWINRLGTSPYPPPSRKYFDLHKLYKWTLRVRNEQLLQRSYTIEYYNLKLHILRLTY